MIRIKRIPEHFFNDEESGKFWDTHSAADYLDEMEEVDIEFDIQRQRFLVSIDNRIYQLAKKQAEEKNCTVEQVINTLLDYSLVGTK